MRKGIYCSLGVVVLVAAWLAFRPELLFINKKVNETLPGASAVSSDPANEPRLLASGQFHDGAHKTAGTASILEVGEGKRVLRLTSFETSNGPDVQVYLGKAADASDNDTVKSAGFTNLGPMKGNVGDQNYEIPAGLELSQHHSVTIWCQRFGVNFGTAPLVGMSK